MYDNFNNQAPNIIDLEPSKPKKQNRVGKAAAFILAVTIIGGTSGFGGAYLSNTLADSTSVSQTNKAAASAVSTSVAGATETNSTNNQTKTVESLADNPSSNSELTTQGIVKKVTPSVVCVSSTFSNGSGTGTGIIMTDDGYIITNAHVVQEEVSSYTGGNGNEFGFYNFGDSSSYTKSVQKASKVVVTTSDGTDYEAEIVGSDASSDLAVLKIKATGLTPAEFGDSESLEMGDKAVAIGYPADLGLSTSEGIVSGLDRKISFELADGGTTEMTLIQTDAAINPGNSGGPLVNENGEVIGITSSKLVDSSIEGLGFAIPITDAMPLINELMNKGYVTNTSPKIGITGSDITSAVQRYYGLPVETGVIVISVEADSGAAKAGISEGDVIVAADGEDVTSMDDLVKIKDSHKAGEKMTVTLARKEGNIDIELVLDQTDN